MLNRSSIKGRLTAGILLTSGAVLALTCGTFLAYEFFTFKRTMAANLTTLARVIASNSTAALAFDNRDDAAGVLSALAAEPHVVSAGLYDEGGGVFARYPASVDADALPPRPDRDGYRFSRTRLVLQQPVINANRRLGTLILQSDLGVLYGRVALYAGLTGGVLALSGLAVFMLSRRVQRYISTPVLELLHTVEDVSARGDYSRRAKKFADDELGRLTDRFNAMLARIQEQDRALRVREEHLEREVAERARAEAEIQALNATLEGRVKDRTHALEAVNKELEAFSYSVSHDLRAPLRAITGFSRILIDDYLSALPAEAADYLRRVANGAKQMGQLVDDLLAFARLGRSPLRRHRIDPADVVRQVLDELNAEQQGRDVRVTVGAMPPCDADSALLKQVYVNLVSNALKFTRNRPGAVVEVGAETNEEGAAVYFVKDNGAGFDMQYANKLFGVFQRLHRSDEYEGTGVGLAIVERVIVRHGGRVWAQAAVGQGASFFFTIGGPQ